MRCLSENEGSCIPLDPADATREGGSTLESVVILAERDKKCLFINIPGLTHFKFQKYKQSFELEVTIRIFFLTKQTFTCFDFIQPLFLFPFRKVAQMIVETSLMPESLWI